jgi:hypothetical protein
MSDRRQLVAANHHHTSCYLSAKNDNLREMEHSSPPEFRTNHQQIRDIVHRLVHIGSDILRDGRDRTLRASVNVLQQMITEMRDLQTAFAELGTNNASQRIELELRMLIVSEEFFEHEAAMQELEGDFQQRDTEIRSLVQRLEQLLYDTAPEVVAEHPAAAIVAESEVEHRRVPLSVPSTSDTDTDAGTESVLAQPSTSNTSASGNIKSAGSTPALDARSPDEISNLARVLMLAARVTGMEEHVSRSLIIDMHGSNMSARSAEALPMRRLETSDLSEDDDTRCAICLAKKNEGDMITELPCGHWFDGDCIKTWLVFSTRTCPMCRSVLQD